MDPTQQGQTAGFDQSLVDHAVRCWDAERENATRLTARVNIVLSVAIALFGLGLFRLEWLRAENQVSRIDSLLAIYLIKSLLTSSLITLAIAFWLLIGSTTPKPERKHLKEAAQDDSKPRTKRAFQAADHLALPSWSFDDPPKDPDTARKLVFARVYLAYLDLRRRNARKRDRLDRGQQWLALALALIGLAILCYIWASEPPIQMIDEPPIQTIE